MMLPFLPTGESTVSARSEAPTVARKWLLYNMGAWSITYGKIPLVVFFIVIQTDFS